MKIAVAHTARFPVHAYGGTERAVWWLVKGLAERGHEVVLCGFPGTTNPYGSVHETDFTGDWVERLPNVDIRHFFFTPPASMRDPYLLTIEGNAKDGEVFPANTVFVSRNHAERHGGKFHVYNGIDLEEYPFSSIRKDHWIFLAKASWRVKNVRGAIRTARKTGVPLDIIGGRKWFLPPSLGVRWRGVRWRGMLGGETKLRAIEGARGLLFPVLWHEPFGIAVIEAMAMGAPVVATSFGSLPELVSDQVGRIADCYAGLEEGVRHAATISPEACRRWVESRFTHRHMTEEYEKLYRKILADGPLHPGPLRVRGNQGAFLTIR